ncbi:hypothetical protein MMC17_005042 [Xylographa soralifera]|nr:hypothetical protein [Xylographa soralifera]
MSSATSSSKVSPPTTGTRGSKSKPSRIVSLKLTPAQLAEYPHEPSARKPPASKASSSASTPIPPKASPISTASNSDSKDVVSSAPAEKVSTPVDGVKKRGVGGPKPGTKRQLGSLSEGITKPRAKPGPKKRPRLDGTVGNDEAARPWTTPAPLAGHKLGPKANQGAINAGLRALDRTGKPCRKWEKKGFSVKSFTGVSWQLPSWRAPQKVAINLKNEAGQGSTPTSNSENQMNQSSSNIGSENDRNGAMDIDIAASSPLPLVASPA